MLRSMTAFARTETTIDQGTIIWELRSVNHRYLDMFIRMPDDFRQHEQTVRQLVSKRLKRGKVECVLRFKTNEARTGISINKDLAKELTSAIHDIENIMEISSTATATEILKWPGVVEAGDIDKQTLNKQIINTLTETLDQLISTREREGHAIAEILNLKLKSMLPFIQEAKEKVPDLIELQKQRLHQRLQEIIADVEPARVEQEIVLFSQKIDIIEELDRLNTHIKEVERVIQNEEPAGRRLDFMMQELNREANTLGSKSVSTETTQISVELKVIIEQMREQVQNLE